MTPTPGQRTTPTVVAGIIVRMTPGSYDCLVQTTSRGLVTCVMGNSAASTWFGAGSVTTPQEGSLALVHLATADATTGCVICCVPPEIIGEFNDQALKTTRLFLPFLFPESNATIYSDDGLKLPLFDPKNRNKRVSPSNRPADTLTGDAGYTNPYGLFMGLFGLIAKIGASSNCGMEFHILEDRIKVMSSQYQHQHAGGDTHMYNDYGFITYEFGMTHLQPETVGMDDYGDISHLGDKDKRGKQLDISTDDLQLKPRLQSFIGAIGDLFQYFAAVPAPGHRTWQATFEDFGVFHAHLSGSGALNVRAAGGFSLVRDDRIVVPKRLAQPQDPQGQDETDPTTFPVTPFRYSADYPGARNLELRHAGEWALAQSYRWFKGMPKDFHLGQPSQQQVPPDDYDAKTAASADFAKNKGKIAGVWGGDDGSIIIRGSNGEEIFLGNGDVKISCPGQVILQSGGSVVVLAGNDAIVKARNSVDVSATEKDVRVKAEGNLHLYSKDKGILLETDSPDRGHGFAADINGEQVQSSGIVMKAKTSTVFIWGNRIQLSAIGMLIRECAGTAIDVIGDVLTTVKNSFRIISSSGKSSIAVTDDSVMLAASSVNVFGGSLVNIIKGKTALVPLQWAEIDVDPYQKVYDQLQPIAETYAAEDQAWQGPYKDEDREHIKFSFRSTPEYGANHSSLYNGEFFVYEAPWQALARGAGTSLEAWTETEVNGTMPWPGKENYDRDALVTINDKVEATSEHMDVPVDTVTLQAQSLNQYKVLKR